MSRRSVREVTSSRSASSAAAHSGRLWSNDSRRKSRAAGFTRPDPARGVDGCCPHRSVRCPAMPDPPDSVLRWAAAALGPQATVTSAVGLRDGSNPWRLQVARAEGTTEVILRAPGDRWGRMYIATGVAALTVAG